MDKNELTSIDQLMQVSDEVEKLHSVIETLHSTLLILSLGAAQGDAETIAEALQLSSAALQYRDKPLRLTASTPPDALRPMVEETSIEIDLTELDDNDIVESIPAPKQPLIIPTPILNVPTAPETPVSKLPVDERQLPKVIVDTDRKTPVSGSLHTPTMEVAESELIESELMESELITPVHTPSYHPEVKVQEATPLPLRKKSFPPQNLEDAFHRDMKRLRPEADFKETKRLPAVFVRKDKDE